jgi:hypothetical protein
MYYNYPNNVDETNLESKTKTLLPNSGTFIPFVLQNNYSLALRIWQEPLQQIQDFSLLTWISNEPWGQQIFSLDEAEKTWHLSKNIDRVTAIIDKNLPLDKVPTSTQYVISLEPGTYFINVQNLENRSNTFNFHMIGVSN